MTYEIDWEIVDNLLTAGCPCSEVAGYLGIHPDTLRNITMRQKNVEFSEYLQQKRSNGKALLRAKQYAKAMGRTDTGDTTLLIWLGKVSLDQKEPKENQVDALNEKKFDEKMNQVISLLGGEVSEPDLNINDNNINNDMKS
jgi:hypothetical protein